MDTGEIGMHCNEDFFFVVLILLKKIESNQVEWVHCDFKNDVYETIILSAMVTIYLGDPKEGASSLRIKVSFTDGQEEIFDYQRCNVLFERENLCCQKIWDVVLKSVKKS